MARQKKEVDWTALEVDYRANMKSMRQLAAEYGISTARIGQVADERSWVRDLAAKIAAKTQAKLDRSILDTKLDNEASSNKRQLEGAVVEANAELRVNVQLSQRKDIQRSRHLAMALLEELEVQTSDVGALHDLGDMLRKEDDKGADKLNDLYHKIISMPGRVDSMKKLSETLKNLIALERQAYNINGGEGDTPPAPPEDAATAVRKEYATLHARFMDISGKTTTTA